MRLIDADALKAIRFHDLPYSQIVSADCDTDEKVSAYKLGWNDAIDAIVEYVPAVDHIKHGHWEVVDETEPRRYGCSVCKKLSWTEDNYCSYCGSKMDEAAT